MVLFTTVYAQRMDPSMDPYSMRYTFVEDSSKLVPLLGEYHVFHLQSGMWWSYHEPSATIGELPEQAMRLLPLFDKGAPKFVSTPVRGIDFPNEQLVVIRGRDTMIVELASYYPALELSVTARTEQMKCVSRPPMIIPFRPGWYLTNGSRYRSPADSDPDQRTVDLTNAFDQLWQLYNDRLVPPFYTDTCFQELALPQTSGMPDTTGKSMTEPVWVMRSRYCSTHMLVFPAHDERMDRTITFYPALQEQAIEPVHILVEYAELINAVDITDWPIGDHIIQLPCMEKNCSFVLKLR